MPIGWRLETLLIKHFIWDLKMGGGIGGGGERRFGIGGGSQGGHL